MIKKYLKTKVKEYDGVIKTNFLDNDVPKENKHYTCIACITIDSAMRMNKKNYPHVYLEECKYKIKKMKKIQTSRSTNTELDLNSDQIQSQIMILIMILIMIPSKIILLINHYE